MNNSLEFEQFDIPRIPLKGKKVAGIDFGTKQVGLAVCDEYHISVSPKGFFKRENADFWEKIIKTIVTERVAAIVVGMPYREDKSVSKLMLMIKDFVAQLHNKTGLPVLLFDESFSTRRAFDTMAEIGMKKKKQRAKGTKDLIAAAVILRDFLDENND
ncbi:MAG TPA: Holliday junction resolvase RuvX [Patescibacteria group bacterium]|nr:Holliday junction resolvase RuvX [Patescibacteria group bacterium]